MYVFRTHSYMCSIHNHILLCIIDDFNFDYIKWNGGRKAILIRNISMFVGRFAYKFGMPIKLTLILHEIPTSIIWD